MRKDALLFVIALLLAWSTPGRASGPWSSTHYVGLCGDGIEDAAEETSVSPEEERPPSVVLTKAPPPAPVVAQNDAQATLRAAAHLVDFMDIAAATNLEREWAIESIVLGMLSKMHVLILGKPGNGKTRLADTFGSTIFDGTPEGPQLSYVRRQLDEETSKQDLIGALDYQIWSTTGQMIRHTDDGILNGHLVFLDETLDARIGILRGINEIMAEFKLSEGRVRTEAKLRMMIGASNEYMSETYRRANSDKPRAWFNRWGYVLIFPIDFEDVSTFEDLEDGKLRKASQLSYQDLDRLGALLPQVKISRAMKQMVHFMSLRYKSLAAIEEKNYFDKWKKERQQNPFAFQEYRPTKYHSVRFANMSLKALRALVVLDWARSGGKRKLIADFDDVKNLQGFFGLDGPNEDFAAHQLAQAHSPDEYAQWRTLEIERKLFQEVYDLSIEGINRVDQQINLTDLNRQFQQAVSPEERAEVSERFRELRKTVTMPQLPARLKTRDFTEDHLGHFVADDFLVECLVNLHGARYDVLNNDVPASAPAAQLPAPVAPALAPEAPAVMPAPAPQRAPRAPMPAPAPAPMSASFSNDARTLASIMPAKEYETAPANYTPARPGVSIVEGSNGNFLTATLTMTVPPSGPRISNAQRIANGRLPYGSRIEIAIYHPQSNQVMYTGIAEFPGLFALGNSTQNLLSNTVDHVGQAHQIAGYGSVMEIDNKLVRIILQDRSGSNFNQFQGGDFEAHVLIANDPSADVSNARAMVTFHLPAGK